MDRTYGGRFLRRWIVFGLGLALAAAPGARGFSAAPEPTPLKIKNGRTIRVVLGKRREPAVGLRPVKDGWPVLLTADLADSSADLQDITPGVAGSRWVVRVSDEKL